MTAPKSPENTTRRVHEDPMSLLATAFVLGPSRAIESMERDGQAQLLASDVLPTDAYGGDAAFLALGFTFGEIVPGDPLFRRATLPAGWTRQGEEHTMWSHIVDERGIRRVGIFYKAAHYDRRADMELIRVGDDIGRKNLYGDEEITAESLKLALLTADERKDLIATIEDMRASIDRDPAIYGKRAEQVAACDRVIAAFDQRAKEG